ncbi:hypothetical protein B296_00047501 [Ensete ventricosum]|uniref:Uncharacterized protein n=1 Tax=Ensete ventricosum TaxID=4639 RepID=A0A426XY29_ENSVE|nr:hypothetical protein B296_00047501 [Ensete ventricosum]
MVTGGVATLVPWIESTASTIRIINGRGGAAAEYNEAGTALAANQSHPRSDGRLVIDSVCVRCLLKHY